jgi:hypothetical protein
MIPTVLILLSLYTKEKNKNGFKQPINSGLLGLHVYDMAGV